MNHKKSDYLTRDKILKLLSDDEVASVATAETARQLADGAEFIDLENFESGVQLAPQTATPMGRVLPKNAVPPATWRKILALLPTQTGS